jgi:hypothetical protein
MQGEWLSRRLILVTRTPSVCHLHGNTSTASPMALPHAFQKVSRCKSKFSHPAKKRVQGLRLAEGWRFASGRPNRRRQGWCLCGVAAGVATSVGGTMLAGGAACISATKVTQRVGCRLAPLNVWCGLRIICRLIAAQLRTAGVIGS